MFDDIRSKLVAAYKAVHDVNCPTIPVNYPNRAVHNPENNDTPFVVMTIHLQPSQLGLGQRNIKLQGEIHLTYFYRPGSGLKGSSDYSDFILANIALHNINGIVFEVVRPYYDAGMEGWEGTLNVVPFQTEYFNV